MTARSSSLGLRHVGLEFNVGAFFIRLGFWGIVYYSYNKEPQKPILIITSPTLGFRGLGCRSRVSALMPLTLKVKCDHRMYASDPNQRRRLDIRVLAKV